MAKIRVNTAIGPILVNIAGDEPTEQEEKAIFEEVQRLESQQPTDTETVVEPEEKQQETETEIDYKTGISDVGFRMFVAKGDNIEEKVARLNKLGVPTEAISQDKKGEVILNRDLIPEEVKAQYNIEGTGLTSIEEEDRFTKADFAEFFSRESGPLIGGIGASLYASGYGIPIAAAITGLGSTLGYLFDEYMEERQGLRVQDRSDLVKGSAFEFSAGAIGETGGRLLTKLFGRILKGAGGDSANDARAISRELLKSGAAPTVKAVNESAILGRLQAIYEGVFPNKKAAEKNAKFVSDRIAQAVNAAGLKGTSANSDEVFQLIQRDLNKIYGTSDDLINQANKDLSKFVDTEIDNLNKMFNKGTMTETEVIQAIQTSKRIFDEDVDAIFTKASGLLNDAEYINTEPLYTKFQELVKANPAAALDQSVVGKLINGFLKKDGTFKNVNISTMTSIKNALRNTDFDPSLIGTPEQAIIGKMLQSVDNSINTANASLTVNPTAFANRFNIDNVSSIKKAVDLMTQGEAYYAKGIKTFQNPMSKNIIKKFYNNDFDPEQLLDELIKKQQGETFEKFLNSIQGVKSQQLVSSVSKTNFDTFIKDKFNLSRAQFDAIPDTDVLKKSIIARYNSLKELSDRVQASRGQGESIKEAVRQTLARKYLERMFVENKNAFGDLSASGVADKITQLGKTGKVLFGKEYDTVMKSLQDISSSGQKLTPREIASLKGRPIAEQVDYINSLTQSTKQVDNQMLMRSLSTAINQGNIEGITDVILRPGRRGVALIRQANNSLGDDTMEAVRESALNRILSELPDPSTGGKEFIEKVFDGSYSTQLKQILKGYDDRVLKELFGEGADVLKKLARQSEIVSQKPIKGLGGLVAATTVTSLSIGSFFTAGLLPTLGLAAGIAFMSKALRWNWFLKLLARPTGVRPGTAEYDKLGRGFEVIYESLGQVGARETLSDPSRQPPEQKTNVVPVQPTSRMQQQVSKLNIAPPSVASSAGGISPLATNPIVNPNPQTQALAQALLQGKV